MQKADAGGQLASRPSPAATSSPGYYNNDPTGLSAPTIIDADQLNALIDEIGTPLALAGIAMDKANTAQLMQSCMMLFGLRGSDVGGTPNAYVVNNTWPVLPSLIDGQRVDFWTARPNTGAATMQVGGQTAQPVTRPDGSALAQNDIVYGWNTAWWNAGLAKFVMRANPTTALFDNFLSWSAAGTTNWTATSAYGLAGIIGGGGGSGGGNNTFASGYGGGGGGAGGMWFGLLPFTVGGIYAITVGAGGAAGAVADPGGNGGTSSIGSLAQATGGIAGAGGGTGASGNAGVGSSSYPGLALQGGEGGLGGSVTAANAATTLIGGRGGGAPWSGGGTSESYGAGRAAAGAGNGAAGGAYNAAGAAGNPGAVFIWLPE